MLEKQKVSMNKLEIKRGWNIVKGNTNRKWAALTSDDLQFIKSKEDELMGRIQKRNREAREAMERALHESRTRSQQFPASRSS